MTEPIKLTPRLWCLPSRSMRYNAGVLASGGQSWLIDPGPHPEEVDEAADLANGLGATLTAIVLTHSHWDHILGPERLPDVPNLAHERFAATLHQHRDATLAMIARWDDRCDYRRTEAFTLPCPDSVARDGQTIELGALELLLLHIPGHAADQLAIFEPSSGALWAADTLSNYEIPFVSHSLTAYETSLARLSDLPIKVLVPGHGDPATESEVIRRRLDDDRAYLDQLRARVTRVVASGGRIEDAVAACAKIAIRAPAENARPHRLNVESVYIELGGPADPARFGWSQQGLIDE